MANARASILLIHLDLGPLFGFVTVPTAGNICFTGPLNEKCEWDLLSATLFPGTTLGVDAGGMTLAVQARTGVAGATTVVLKAATDVTVGAQVASTSAELFRGRKSFLPGEFVQLVSATDGTLTTPAIGASVCLEIEITERSGS